MLNLQIRRLISERMSNLPKFIRLIGGKMRIHTQASFLPPKPMLFPLLCCRVVTSTQNPQIPEGKLAHRLESYV